MIRVRHYTRVSAMRKILAEQRIIARDQNKISAERASSRRLSPADAECKYGLDPGKANACVEFDVEIELIEVKYNPRFRTNELLIAGDIDLTGRNVATFLNY